MIPMKNVEETDPSCERQADDSDFIWPSLFTMIQCTRRPWP